MQPPKYVTEYCDENGYTEPFYQEHRWWAFPPNGVMPVVIQSPVASDRLIEYATTLPARFSTEMSVHYAVRSDYEPGEVVDILYAGFAQVAAMSPQPDTIVVIEGTPMHRLLLEMGLVTEGVCERKEPDHPLECAIGRLGVDHNLPYPVAKVRIQHFQERHNLSDHQFWDLLSSRHIQMKHGVLCKGKGYDRNKRAQAPVF